MTSPVPPPALSPVQVAELKVLMTPAGYQAVLDTFDEETIAHFVASRACLLLAGADLLDGLPGSSGEGSTTQTQQLTSFKLDVLEFKFATGTATDLDYATISKNLRTRAITECRGEQQRTANPAPNLEGWGIG